MKPFVTKRHKKTINTIKSELRAFARNIVFENVSISSVKSSLEEIINKYPSVVDKKIVVLKQDNGLYGHIILIFSGNTDDILLGFDISPA